MKELLLSQLVFCSLNQNHKLDSRRKNQYSRGNPEIFGWFSDYLGYCLIGRKPGHLKCEQD